MSSTLTLIELEEKKLMTTHEQIEKLVIELQDLGLTKNESKIYVFLSKNGPKKVMEIFREEKIPRTETYKLLTNLENKGFITPIIQRPTIFSAVTIEKAIESVIHNQQKKIDELKILKHDMIELWNSFQNKKDERSFLCSSLSQKIISKNKKKRVLGFHTDSVYIFN